jgi:hypothetical protein
MSILRDRFWVIWEKLSWFLWLGLVSCLPITSLPIFARLLHTSSVAPASGIFVILLAVFWLPVYTLKKGGFPGQVKPVLFFVLIVLLSICLAFFRAQPFYPNASVFSSVVEALAMLGMGVLFYLVSTCLPNEDKKFKTTFKVSNWSGLVMLIWSVVQIVVFATTTKNPDLMEAIQSYFSTTVLFTMRASGFASEPSWHAHQLNLVYLAYWLAATIKKTSVHPVKIWKFTFENLLLGLGVIVLFFTFSRGGLGAFMLVLAFLFLRLNLFFVRWIVSKWKVKRRIFISILAGVGIFIIYLFVAFAGLFVLSKIDPRMEKVFQFTTESANPLMKYADNLQFGERIAYWQTGWNIFNDYPIIGVGLNFAGNYFPKYLPDYGWQLTETKNLLFRSNGMLNIKNLWTRLLAETGIMGFSLFVVFLLVTLFTAKELVRMPDPGTQTIGWMGIFALIAFIIEGFSVDSLALPYYWFTLGLVAAAWRWKNPIWNKDTNG